LQKQVSNEGSQSSEKVTKVVVAVSGSPKPYNYVNENGELDGYEIAILKEIAKRLPEVELEFEKTDFAGLFAGLDSNRYQVVANNMTKKPEREEKYLFGDTSYVKNHTIIAVREGETSIKTIDDLQGKNVPGSSAGNATTLFLEKYNETHKDNPINIIYTDADYSAILQDVQNGRFDAYVVAQTYVDTAETISGAMLLVNKKEIEGRIILPQALLVAIPNLGNTLISLVKSTFLRTLNFLDSASSGEIKLDDIHIDVSAAKKDNILNIRRNTAMVFQGYNLFKNRTALENVNELCT